MQHPRTAISSTQFSAFSAAGPAAAYESTSAWARRASSFSSAGPPTGVASHLPSSAGYAAPVASLAIGSTTSASAVSTTPPIATARSSCAATGAPSCTHYAPGAAGIAECTCALAAAVGPAARRRVAPAQCCASIPIDAPAAHHRISSLGSSGRWCRERRHGRCGAARLRQGGARVSPMPVRASRDACNDGCSLDVSSLPGCQGGGCSGPRGTGGRQLGFRVRACRECRGLARFPSRQ